jgi:phosphomethylpyrimidine synthase
MVIPSKNASALSLPIDWLEVLFDPRCYCLGDCVVAQIYYGHVNSAETDRFRVGWHKGEENGARALEGPGHVPLDQIEANVKLEKSICRGAPFYVLGPLVTDVAPGYDHVVSAIGGAVAAMSGADFLCYVTPAEHIALPDVEDVREGVLVARIAAHAADLVRRRDIASQWDYAVSKARSDLDWEAQSRLSIDPERLKRIRTERAPKQVAEVCTMCGEYCAIRLLKDYVRSEH